MSNLRPVKFYFGDDPVYDGFTDDTYWNGFLNVQVTPEVHKQIVEYFAEDYKILGYEDIDLAEAMESFDIQPSKNGLISYAYGFATCEDEPCTS